MNGTRLFSAAKRCGLPIGRVDVVADARGAAIVEFAIVVIPFLAVVFAALSTSLVYFAQQNLETVAATAARSVLTGSAQSAATSQSDFKAHICSTLPAYMKCSNLLVSVDRSVDFASAGMAPPAITVAGNGAPSGSMPYNLGAPGDIVTLRLYYVWQLPVVSLGYDITTLPNGRRLLIATAVAKTEQYS